MAKAKKKSYSVYARSVSIIQIDIEADSLEDARAKAMSLDPSDFEEYKGDLLDGDFRIISVGEADWKIHDDV
jgi:hypothetical protein